MIRIDKKFGPCEICGTDSWVSIYEGPVRSGGFGSFKNDGTVAICNGCGVGRLAESDSIDAKAYETKEYRVAVDQGLEVADFFHQADPIQIHHLTAAWPGSFRGKTVADIGCGAGSFIDHISGLAEKIIAIEPTAMYQNSLRKRGYEVYSYASEAIAIRPDSVDLAVTFQVIEHVQNPRTFLAEIFTLLKPGGTLLIATPNRNDIMMKLLPEEFPAFFYRIVHRWYFDCKSLKRCAIESGYTIESERYLHTMNMSNMLSWLIQRRPTGNTNRLPGIENEADTLWNIYLQSSGQADTLFLKVTKPLNSN
ncbi:MAG: class I SAM-dependent methyltransferase [Bacteroidetes bacterium]|nr:class I SAM-dependent methyltransferase [Bacteroidota bacterium]